MYVCVPVVSAWPEKSDGDLAGDVRVSVCVCERQRDGGRGREEVRTSGKPL